MWIIFNSEIFRGAIAIFLMKYDTKELCKDWKLDGDWKSMEAVVVAEMEKHLSKYFVQHIQKYSKNKQTFNQIWQKKELCDDWELQGDWKEYGGHGSGETGSTLKLLPTLMAPLKPPTH